MNVGTLPPSPTPCGAGKAQRPLMAAGGDGAFVVVGAGESPVHGEGRQRACSARLEGEEVAGEYRRFVAAPKVAQERVLGIQRKLHKWAQDDQDRRFSDLHNLVWDPATLMVACTRVRANQGSRSAGVDGQSAAYVEQVLGVQRFLTELREELRSGSYRPLPVKERKIPKRGGKLRRLGIATVRDRVVQAAVKLVLEPIFEVDFQLCSYGFRPGRRAQDAIAEVHFFTTHSYEVDGGSGHRGVLRPTRSCPITDGVRARIADKRVLMLVKAFLKAGIMSEHGGLEAQLTGTPQGGILSPLMSNIALSALDQHYARAWEAMGDTTQRAMRRRHGEANYRLVRYADDFVVCVAGDRQHAEALVETEQVIRPLGLALSPEKTRVTHIDEGIEFLGWRIKRQRGRDHRPHVYTYPSKRSLAAVMAKVSRGRTTTSRSASSCTASTRYSGAGAPTSKAGSPRAPSATCAPTPGGGSFAGCAGNTARRTGAGSGAATSRGGGRPTARRCSSTPAACGPPATATGPRTSRRHGRTTGSPCASRPCRSNAWRD